MEKLFETSSLKLRSIKIDFERYLAVKIDWKDRLIAIMGARGCGKTTLLLQYIKRNYPQSEDALYISLDDIYFTTNRLIDVIDDFVKQGGRYLFIDEVHKYTGWSREIKNAYDTYADLKIVFTGSSMLQVHKSEGDLSRRAVVYEMLGLSFREYLIMNSGKEFPVLTVMDIINNHVSLSKKIATEIKPLMEFKNYLKHGYYPYFLENKSTYLQRLSATVNLVLELDLPSVERIDYSTIHKLKKLLYIIATSVPFKPNIEKLSQQTNATRGSVLLYLDYLRKAQLIGLLKSPKAGDGYMNKPEKIYLNNTNLMYALEHEQPSIGTVRETFFMNQLQAESKVHYTEKGDFLIDKNKVFEIGGKNKTFDQIKDLKNSFIAADGIETGFKNKIPLWLFGFLY